MTTFVDYNIPDDQQEDENDIVGPITFKDAVTLNADWTIETIYTQIQKGNIELQPGFQRRVAWDVVRKSHLIESIIVGVPIPNIVLAENKDHRGRFIVIDGKQRLASIKEFFEGSFQLKRLSIRNDINDRKFSELGSEDKQYFENSTIRATVIRNWGSEGFLYTIFFRLNSGSLPLSPQELRRALVGGQLLDNIDNYLVNSQEYKAIFGDQLDRRMRDSELVLRFLAFDRGLTAYRGDFKKFLDETTQYFECDWGERSIEANVGLARLNDALALSQKIFGGNAFKKWLGNRYERVINRAVFDCHARFFAQGLLASKAAGKESDIEIAFQEICLEPEFRDSVEKTTKSVQATVYRINRWGARLAECIGGQYDSTNHRIF